MADIAHPPVSSLPPPPALVNLRRKSTAPVAPPSQWYKAWVRFQRNTLAMIGLFIVLCFLGVALGADSLAPYRPNFFDFNQLAGEPTLEHFLGTDSLGRDMLTLLMYGSRVSVTIGMVVPLAVMALGIPLGVAAGYIGGRVDALLMRFTDIVMGTPMLMVALLSVVLLGRNLWTVIMVLSLTGWPPLARVVRAETMRLRNLEFVVGARSIGVPPQGIVLDHIFPNLIGPIAVTIAILIPTAIIEESTLTFLNIGIDVNGLPSWAQIIRNEFQGVFSRPSLVLFPSVAISLLTIAFTFVGDALRDAFDPHLDRPA
jgi:ABC-type dipeptide/oligopeptide/nickel transport system permease subunit